MRQKTHILSQWNIYFFHSASFYLVSTLVSWDFRWGLRSRSWEAPNAQRHRYLLMLMTWGKISDLYFWGNLFWQMVQCIIIYCVITSYIPPFFRWFQQWETHLLFRSRQIFSPRWDFQVLAVAGCHHLWWAILHTNRWIRMAFMEWLGLLISQNITTKCKLFEISKGTLIS